MYSVKVLALCVISCCCCLGINAKLQERFSWTQLTFDWPSAEAETEAKTSGHYIAENNLPLGVERWENKLFVTVPR